MPIIVQYLFKLSVSLGIMYLFYQVVLRRLTFYSHNRWYLFGYSVLSFFIAFINVSPILEKTEVSQHEIVTLIPAVETLTKGSPTSLAGSSNTIGSWAWLIGLIAAGVLFMLFRLVIQCISFKKLRDKARLITDEDVRFYQVDENIIPFSFGNSIFINQQLHSEAELKEIIRHEFVHVRQRHTWDIIWSEVLCIFNWYNPFAWLIRKAIRQNLEFIADNNVIANGVDKTAYQYLLLKVTGNKHFSIVQNFNFSSLKKRIIMMNRVRTARLHLIKFLFVLPLLAIVLLSFRRIHHSMGTAGKNSVNNGSLENGMISYAGVDMYEEQLKKDPQLYPDTIPDQSSPNSKGFYIDVKDNQGNCTVVIRDRARKEIGKLLLTEWDKNKKHYENLYGEILPPSDCPLPAVNPSSPISPVQPASPAGVSSPVSPVSPSSPASPLSPVKKIQVKLRNIEAVNGVDQPLVLVDGEEWPQHLDLNLIDPMKIESISVLKNEAAINKYGDKAKNGVIVILTKDQSITKTQNPRVLIKEGVAANPVYYLNGKETSKQAVELLDPASIKSINVIKGAGAKEKYGEKGKNGVIEIISVPSTKTNFIEQNPIPAFDIKNILPGKKPKDEC